MDHVSSWFQAAVVPDRWNVAGVSCGVLSVWHVFVLQQTENPYYCGGALDRDAAAALLAYCSNDYDGGKRMFSSPLFRASVLKRTNAVLKKQDWEETHAAIRDYLSTCTRVPGHKQVVSSSKGAVTKHACAPMCWVLVDFLSNGDPSKVNTAWNTPYQTARCMFDARRDIKGEDDSLETPEEEKRFDEFQNGVKQ